MQSTAQPQETVHAHTTRTAVLSVANEGRSAARKEARGAGVRYGTSRQVGRVAPETILIGLAMSDPPAQPLYGRLVSHMHAGSYNTEAPT